MPKANISIATGFYQSESLPICNKICTNLYPNIPQTDGALSTGTLIGSSGLYEIANTGALNNINRGGHVKNGVPYFVNGTSLYRVDRSVSIDDVETITTVNLGIIEGSSRVSMSDNGKQLIILIPGGKGYIVDEDSLPIFQEITDVDFYANGNPQHVVFINSFFICTTDTKKFIRSAANDGLSWNALDSGTAEADPDNIVAPIVHKNQLFLGGSETIEVFEGVPSSGLGFQRINGFIINKGVFAPFSLIDVSDTFMFIGGGLNESPAIWALSGSTVQKVSNTAIDVALQKFSNEEINTAFSYSYSQGGSSFVGFTVGNRTFEFNTITNLWNERDSQVLNTKGVIEIDRWRVNSLVTAYNRVIVADYQDGRIGVLDSKIYTEYDREIIREFSTQPLADNGNALTIPMIELTCESGVGDANTPDPVIRMSRSKDGKTFNNEITRSLGKIGEYNTRCIWRKNGRASRFEMFKFTISDPIKVSIISLVLNVRAGASGN